MKFTPLSDEQIAEFGLIPESEVDFEILNAQEKVSSKGNDMIELNVQVFAPDGSARTIRDWIMPSFMKKFKHCLDACGLTSKYESGEIAAADFIGKTGKLKITIGAPNDNGVRYNQVFDYVKRAGDFKEKVKQAVSDLSDEIPFGFLIPFAASFIGLSNYLVS